MSRKHMAYSAIGAVDRHSRQAWPTKHTICDVYGACQTISNILKPVFLPNLTDSLCLRVPWIPRSQFSCRRWQTTTTDKTICFTACACTWGNKKSVYNMEYIEGWTKFYSHYCCCIESLDYLSSVLVLFDTISTRSTSIDFMMLGNLENNYSTV